MKVAVVWATLVGLSLPASASAQVPLRASAGESTCFPEHPGSWQSDRPNLDSKTFGLNAAQEAEFMSNVHAFTSVLRAADVFNPPLGFNAEVAEDICCASGCRRDGTCTTHPAAGRVWIRLHYFLQGRDGTPIVDRESYGDILVWVNNPYAIFNGDPLLRFPDGREAARMPLLWREVGGVDMYVNNDDLATRWVFLTRSGEPPWIPVTREQYLTELIREREADMEEDFGKDASALAQEGRAFTRRMLIEPLRAELDRLSPTARASQAWVLSPNMPMPLVPANTTEARPVVIARPDYFDLSRPRTDIQLATIGFDVSWELPPEQVLENLMDGRIENASDVGVARVWQWVTQVDWRELAGLVR